jgi:hypothetical protein
MSENTTFQPEEKQGFFSRLFTKIDTAMKQKADAQEGCCCCNDSAEKEKSGDSGCEANEEKKADKKCC